MFLCSNLLQSVHKVMNHWREIARGFSTSVMTAVVFDAPCMFSAINLVFIFTNIHFHLTSMPFMLKKEVFFWFSKSSVLVVDP